MGPERKTGGGLSLEKEGKEDGQAKQPQSNIQL